MLTSSAKAKGRALCKWLKGEILERFPTLTGDDVRVTSSGAGGEDITLSTAGRAIVPFQFECKAYARFAGYAFLAQAEHHGSHVPVVIVKGNHREPIAMLYADDFLALISKKGL